MTTEKEIRKEIRKFIEKNIIIYLPKHPSEKPNKKETPEKIIHQRFMSFLPIYNKIRELDFQLGRLFSDLANLDMLDNTAFILCSDHGVNLPSDGTPNWQNKLFTKERLNVPFLIRCPWLKKNNKLPIDFFVESSIDLLPTVLDIAGINVTNTRDYSLSCLPKMNEEKKLKKYAVSEYIFEGDYKCKIHTSKFIYLREFNWYKDVDEKETIFDTKTNRKIEIDSDHYMNLLSYFKTLNKKLKLETIESLKAKSN